MESLSASSKKAVKQHSLLFRLTGKQLLQPSFNQVPYMVIQVIECFILILYPVIQYFSPTNSLKLQTTWKDVVNSKIIAIAMSILIPLALIFVTVTIIMILVNFYKIKNFKQDQENLITKFLSRTINKINVLFRTVLFMPLLHFLISAFSFDLSESGLNQSVQKIIAALGIIEFMLLFIYFCILTEVSNPFSKHPWSCPSSIPVIIKSVIKTLVIVYVQFQNQIPGPAIYTIQFILSLCWILNALFLSQLYFSPQKLIQRGMISIYMWMNLSMLITSSSGNQSEAVYGIFIFIGMIFVLVTFGHLYKMAAGKHIQNLQAAESETMIVKGIVETIASIESKEYHKYFSKHFMKCKVDICSCRRIVQKISKKQQIIDEDYYTFLQKIVIDKLKSVNGNQYIQLLLGYIYLVKLKVKNSAILLLNMLKQNISPHNIITKYRIESLEQTIENYVYELSDQSSKQLQVERCYMLNKMHTEFRELIFKMCNNIIEFWKVLNIKNYDMEHLYKVNRFLIQDSKFINKKFKQLYQNNPTNKQFLTQYIQFRDGFLSEDILQYKDVLDDLKRNIDGQGKYLNPMNAIFLNSAKPGVVVVAANQNNFNIIQYANSYLYKKTCFFSKNLLGQSLDILIPIPFREKHEGYMRTYLCKEQSQKMQNFRIHMYDYNKNIILASMMVSVLNDVSQGLLFISIINFDQINQKLLYVTQNGVVYGVSRQFTNEFGKIIQENTKDIFTESSLQSVISGTPQCLKMKVINQVDSQYEKVESQPFFYDVRIRLKQKMNIGSVMFYVFSIQQLDRQVTMQNIDPSIQQQSAFSDVNFDDENYQFQAQISNKMFQNVMFKKRQPIRIILAKVLGLLTVFIMIAISIYNVYHFMDQIQLMIQQYSSLLSLSKTNLRIVDNSILARRLNIYSFYQPSNLNMYKYYQKFYNVSILKMNSVYYEQSSQILKLKGMGFDDSNADLSATFWTFPDRRQDTQLYNLLTMYIQAVTNLGGANMSDLAVQPIRQYISPYPKYKQQLQKVIINTYASILPKFDVITPAINQFWNFLIHRDDYGWYIILVFVIVYIVALTIALALTEYYYIQKFQKTVNLMTNLPKTDINMMISNVENYQYKMFPEYYQNNWINALFYLFQDNDPTKGIRGSNQNSNTTSNNVSNIHSMSATSNVLVHAEQETKLRKKTKSKTSKQYNQEDQKKSAFNLKLKYRSYKHILVFIVFVGIILIYFIADFGVVRVYMKKLLVTTQQLSQILERMKLISSMRYVTYQSLFQLKPWPSNTSLFEQAKDYNNQLFINEQKLQSAEVTYPEWTQQIFKLNQVDICSDTLLYAGNNDYHPTFDNCTKTMNGVLKKGFSPALSSFATASQTFSMMSSPNMTDSTLNNTLFSQSFQEFNDLTQYLLSASKYLRNLYLTVMVDKYKQYGESFKIKGYVFCVVLILMLFLWNFVVNQLNILTEQLKGLLRLITLLKIQKTESIKKQLIDQGIIESLK